MEGLPQDEKNCISQRIKGILLKEKAEQGYVLYGESDLVSSFWTLQSSTLFSDYVDIWKSKPDLP